MTTENQSTIDNKKLRRLFKKNNKATESILHGMVSIAYEKAPALKNQYEQKDWEGFFQNANFIGGIYQQLVNKEVDKNIQKLNRLASNKLPCSELTNMVEEMEHLSKDVVADVERYLHREDTGVF